MSEGDKRIEIPGDVIAALAVGFAESEAEAGAREIGGNNAGPWVEKYLNANHPERTSHQGEPWCVAFYLWCWMQALQMAKRELPFAFTRSAGDLWARMQLHGQVQRLSLGEPKPGFSPAPGDAAFWDFTQNGAPDHVNMVHHIDDAGVIYTIGGNEGSEESTAPVRIKRRGTLAELPRLYGFGRVLAGGA